MQPHVLAAGFLAAFLAAPAFLSPASGGSTGGSNPLVVTCPEALVKVFCGDPLDPSATGEPDVSGGCPPYTINYSDVTSAPPSCPAGRFVESLTRTWTISDSCGNSTTCRQVLHIVKQVVALDLHPTSCPNPLNRGSSGVYPAAINGSATFDVTTIVPGSLQLWGFNCNGGPAIPIPAMTQVSDVSTAYFPGASRCTCTTDGPDGFPDLIFKFDTPSMVAALGLNQYARKSFVQLVIVGQLTNGCEFIGVDCVRVQ